MPALLETPPVAGSAPSQSELANQERINDLFGSPTFKFIGAAPGEELEVYRILPGIHDEQIVKEGREILSRAGDEETQSHQDRVMGAGHIVLERISRLYADPARDPHLSEIPDEQLNTLSDIYLFDLTAAVHDVGKSRPDIQKLVNLPRRLSDVEMKTVGEHADESATYINESNLDDSAKQDAVMLAASHHAYKSNGPTGTKVTGRLQLMAETLAFVDMIDGLASNKKSGRAYKDPYSRQKTIDILGSEFTGQYKELLMQVCFGDQSQPHAQSSRFIGHSALQRA